METWKNIWRNKTVKKELYHVCFLLLIVRILSAIPVPGINASYFKEMIQQNSSLDFLNTMTGNSLSSMTFMALSITPFITASIMIQLLGVVFPKIHEMERGMEDERKLIKRATILLGGVIALLESFTIATSFGKRGLLIEYRWYWVVLTTVIWTAGALIASLVGEQIQRKYHYNGSSLILLTNILVAYPTDMLTVMDIAADKDKIARSTVTGIFLAVFILLLFGFTVFVHETERRIPVYHSQKIQGSSMQSSIPLKLCPGTVVPIIFASSILTFPGMIGAFLNKSGMKWLSFFNTNAWFDPQNLQYTIGALLYIALIIAFSFYYASIIFNPIEVSADLKKRGASVMKIRPGKETSDYLRKKSNETVGIGSIALCLIAFVPILVSAIWSINGIAFLGTSIIITVGVALELRAQVTAKIQGTRKQTYLF